MVDRRFILIFLLAFGIVSFSGFIWMKLFYLKQQVEDLQQQTTISDAVTSCAYEEIDMSMPIQVFLKRAVNSVNLSIVKRVFVNQWIYLNQQDLIKLIMYVQGAMTFVEMEKAFEIGIAKEGPKNGAISFVKGALDTIRQNPELVKHVDKSLKEGFSADIHRLRGQMMDFEKNSKEYRKLKIEYRKALDAWTNEKHGKLIDDLILKI